MTKRAKRKHRRQLRRLGRQVQRMERRQAKLMVALRRDTIHAVYHILEEWADADREVEHP